MSIPIKWSVMRLEVGIRHVGTRRLVIAQVIRELGDVGIEVLRPFPSTVTDIVGVMDPDDDIAKLSPQAKGRLINASEDWEAHYPMIMESWYEDSDEITEAISSATTPTALKRALWKALDDRREHCGLLPVSWTQG